MLFRHRRPDFGQMVASGVRLPGEGITRCSGEHAGEAGLGEAGRG